MLMKNENVLFSHQLNSIREAKTKVMEVITSLSIMLK